MTSLRIFAGQERDFEPGYNGHTSTGPSEDELWDTLEMLKSLGGTYEDFSIQQASDGNSWEVEVVAWLPDAKVEEFKEKASVPYDLGDDDDA